jgi:DNA-binding IclR family transcriptional regulator
LAAAIGQRLPSYATASGKAILAFVGEDLVWRVIKHGMHKFTQNTHPTPEALFDDLRLVREQGYAISEQEYEEEINAIAAPIFGRNNQPVGSLAVAGPAYRLSRERMIEISPVLVAITSEIRREINW